VIILLVVGLVFLYQYIGIHQTSAIPEVKSGITGYCLDLFHDKKTTNSTVDSYPCNGRDSQNWVAAGNEIKHDNNYCLAVETTGGSSGNIVANPCNNTADQTWVSAIGGYENPTTALCLSVPGGKTESQLTAADCKYLTEPAELWQPTAWSKSTINQPVSLSCNTGTEGQQIACNTAKQWVIWQNGSVSHNDLLNQYTDGNGYEEWCADFVSYIYKISGYPFSNGERDGWDEYLAYNIQNMSFTYHDAASYTPKTGDVAYFNYTGGHVEIVAVGGTKPIFIYGDSATTDPSTGNGQMTENTITNDGDAGQVIYYLSPS